MYSHAYGAVVGIAVIVLAQLIDARVAMLIGLALLGLRMVHLKAKANFYQSALAGLSKDEARKLAEGRPLRMPRWGASGPTGRTGAAVDSEPLETGERLLEARDEPESAPTPTISVEEAVRRAFLPMSPEEVESRAAKFIAAARPSRMMEGEGQIVIPLDGPRGRQQGKD